MNRRVFTLLAAAAAAMGSLPERAIAAAGDPAPPWYRTIRRIGQTNFNERDPEFGDVGAWAEFWAAEKVQAMAPTVEVVVPSVDLYEVVALEV